MAGLRIMVDKSASTRREGRRALRAVVSGLMSMTVLTALVIGAVPAHAAETYVGTSFSGTLLRNQYILSTNRYYKLIMQSDGNLVLYRGFNNGVWTACWGSGTVGEATSASYYRWSQQEAVLQVGPVYIFGNLDGRPLFDTNVNVNNSGVLYVADSPRAWC